MSAKNEEGKAAHTALPWMIDPKHPLCLEARDGNIGLMNLARKESPANAELIVRAVNSHQALVEALQFMLAIVVDEFPRSNRYSESIAQALAALRRATQ